MNEQERQDIYRSLYSYALMDEVSEHLKRIEPEILIKLAESRAIRTLEAIRRMLDDKRYDDPDCFERTDTLVMLFYKELGIRIDRHSELD